MARKALAAGVQELHQVHFGERQRGPAVARWAVGVELVVAGVQARDAAEVDHGLRIAPRRAHPASHDLSESTATAEPIDRRNLLTKQGLAGGLSSCNGT